MSATSNDLTPAASAAPATAVSGSNCQAQVDDLAAWMKSAVAEGAFARDVSDKDALAKTSLPPAWVEPGPELRVTPKQILLDGMPLASARAQAAAKLRTDLASKRNTAKTLGNGGQLPLNVYVARDTPWARVAEAGEIIEAAGESDVRFVVEASESKVAPPPRSSVADDELSRCEPARRLNEEVGKEPHSPRSKLEKLAKEMPARIQSCSCDVDMDAVKARYWSMLNRVDGRPVSEISLSLSKTGTVMKVRGAATWQEAVEQVSSASREGKPVHLMAQ